MKHPYRLLISTEDEAVSIDLDEPGWLQTYRHLLRAPGEWHLAEDAPPNAVVLSLLVQEGEQPYYVARHIGFVLTSGGAGSEIVAYGLGKKRVDGHVDRLWRLPNGLICAGDDVEHFALKSIKGGYANGQNDDE